MKEMSLSWTMIIMAGETVYLFLSIVREFVISAIGQKRLVRIELAEEVVDYLVIILFPIFIVVDIYNPTPSPLWLAILWIIIVLIATITVLRELHMRISNVYNSLRIKTKEIEILSQEIGKIEKKEGDRMKEEESKKVPEEISKEKSWVQDVDDESRALELVMRKNNRIITGQIKLPKASRFQIGPGRVKGKVGIYFIDPTVKNK